MECQRSDRPSQDHLKDWKRQFSLRDARVTTPAELIEKLTELEALESVFEKYTAEDRQRRDGLTENEQAKLPAQIRMACTARPKYDPSFPETQDVYHHFRMITISTATVSPSGLDTRNLDLPWKSALAKSLRLPPLPLHPDTNPYLEVKRLVDVYESDKEWLERGRSNTANPLDERTFMWFMQQQMQELSANGGRGSGFDRMMSQLHKRKMVYAYVRGLREHPTDCECCNRLNGHA